MEAEREADLKKRYEEYWQPIHEGNTKWKTITELREVLHKVECLMDGGIEAKNILVSFDFDGTLAARGTVESAGLDRRSQEAKRVVYLEELKTIDVLNTLNDKNIPYFVNTANPSVCTARDDMEKHEFNFYGSKHIRNMPFSKVLTKNELDRVKSKIRTEHMGKPLNICGNVLSARYGKEVPIDYVISHYKLPTKIIIHVDDGIINLKNVMERGFSQLVIGLYFPTVKGTAGGAEPDDKLAWDYLTQNSKPIQEKDCFALL